MDDYIISFQVAPSSAGAAPDALSAYLNASTPGGPAPVTGVVLTAVVSGSATGNMTYTFYCNRSDANATFTTPYDLKYDNISDTTKITPPLCNYLEPGAYTAKVLVQRGVYLAENRFTIAVGKANFVSAPSSNLTNTTTAESSVTQTSPFLAPNTGPVSSYQTFPEVGGPLGVGMSSDNVKILQEMLKADADLSKDASITGYYGSETVAAVQKFQVKYGIVTQGSPETTGYGLAGPWTRAKLNQLYANQSFAVSSSASGGNTLTREQIQAKIKELQAILISLLQQMIQVLKSGSKTSQ